jgi:L-fuculose-phosphate aldolase
MDSFMETGSYRQWRKMVLDACMWLSEQGYFGSLRGSGGNVSVRIDECAMAVTPSGIRYQEMTVDDICILRFGLDAIEVKSGRHPSMESGMHGMIYQNRPDAGAVVHTHQTYGSVFALTNTAIPALFDEVALSLGPVIEVVPYAFSGSRELADNVASKLSNLANAYIIQNHGIVTLGKTLHEAMLHAELVEKTARIYALALSTGKSIGTLPAFALDKIAALRKMT